MQLVKPRPFAVSVSLTSKGTVHQNYGQEDLTLRLGLQCDGVKLTHSFLLARGTDGYGSADPVRQKLFECLHSMRCDIDCRAHVAVGPDATTEDFCAHISKRVLSGLGKYKSIDERRVVEYANEYFSLKD